MGAKHPSFAPMDERPHEPIPPLAALLRAEVAATGGALPFDRFMEAALYEPGVGYYSQPGRARVGRGGDFVTSVSVGRCFGLLLARHFAPSLESMAKATGGELAVVESGPESGDLACDLMEELRAVLPAEVGQRLRYVGVEPDAGKRGQLEARLERDVGGGARAVGALRDLAGLRGVFVANEVLDAMPVKRFRLAGERWLEVGVAPEGGGFREVERAVDDPVAAAVAAALPLGLGDGFTVEWAPGLEPWFGDLAAAFEVLRACVIDYGLPSSAAFLDPGRRRGTLRAYRSQHLLEDPFAVPPGEADLTAHVDFERAAAAAEAAGLGVAGLTEQGRFLTAAARPWLLEIEARRGAPDPATAKLLRQFTSLAHPGAMGATFYVLELSKG